MRKRKATAFLCAAALLVSGLAGCGQKTESAPESQEETKEVSGDTSEKIELVVGGIDRGNSADNQWWPTEIVQQINEKLNIELKLVNYDQQKLGLDLASGELPDVMLIYRGNVESVVKGKHAVALNEYFDTIGKNLASERFDFRNKVMAQYQSGGDGNVYFTTPYVSEKGGGEAAQALGLGYVVRWDLYKEIGAPEINTPDDYIAAMKKMQELYPKTPEGLPTYAMGMYNDVGMHTWSIHGIFDSNYTNLDSNLMYLLDKETYEVSHNVVSESFDTPFWNDMRFYNKMWKEGLLDPDCFITKGEDLTAKYTKGQYLGGINNWYYGEYNQNVLKDTSSIAGMEILPAYNTWQGGYSQVGWNDKLLFVSAHSKNVERAVMFLDYINSEEFARLQYSGVKGEHWDVGEDGKPYLTDKVIQMKEDPAQADAWSKLALSSWNNWGGIGASSVLSDGAPASLWNTPEMLSRGLSATDKDMCETLGVSYPAEYARKRVEAGICIDNSTYDQRFSAVMPSVPQDVTRIDGNVNEIVMSALPGLVQAADDAAFEAARDQLIADVKAANMEQSLKWWQESVKTALEQVKAME